MTDGQIALAVTVVLAVVMVLVLVPRRTSTSPQIEGRLDELGDTLHGLDTRLDATERGLLETNHNLAQVRQIISGLPTREEVHRVELKMGELGGRMETIDRVTQSTQRSVETLDRFIRKLDT